MTIVHKIKKAVEFITGYWIFKRSHLPKGVDLIIDLENEFKNRRIEVIFDVGANTGQSVEYFKTFFPKATIYSFEPVKSTFDQLKQLSKTYSGVVFENIGLGSKTGKTSIYIEKHSSWNSIIPNEQAPGATTEMIELNTIDNYIRQKDLSEVSLLKIDTEGFDLEVLKGAQVALSENKISFIYVEIGLYSEDKRHSHLPSLIDYLKYFGYYFHALYDYRGYGIGSYGNALFVNKNLISR